MTNVWVCGACRSINQPREQRCYKCRTPRDLGQVDPETLVVAGAGSKPTVDPKAAVGTYRSSAGRALTAQALIVFTIVVTTMAKVLGADAISRVLDGREVADADATLVAILGAGGLLLAVATLVAFGLWLSQVVANVPTLGLGWPNVTPSAAFIENLIPGVNVLRVPAIVRDVMTRLDTGPRGEAFIAASWLGLVGGVMVPRFARYVIGPLSIESPDTAIGLSQLVGQVSLGLSIVGAVFLIVIIRRVEEHAERRSQGQAASPAAVPEQPAGPEPAGADAQ
jgi:hypothetical protein